MNQQVKARVLVVLGVILAALLLYQMRGNVPAVSGAAADEGYKPMAVDNPALHLDRLERLRKLEYKSTGRDIFSAELPPPPKPSAPPKPPSVPGPTLPPPDPPLTVPFKFYGFSADARTGTRKGFFNSGDEVFIAAEGELVQGKYKVIHIGNNNAEVEEVSSGKRATLNMEAPAAGSPQGSPQG
jgi:hypothetical protein